MTDQEKKDWIKRNLDCYSNVEEAREDLEKRLARKDAKETRELKIFKSINEYHNYAKDHKMGRSWTYDSSNFNGEYSDEYEDYVAVCAYEYK